MPSLILFHSENATLNYMSPDHLTGGSACVTSFLTRQGFFPTFKQAEDLWQNMIKMMVAEEIDWSDFIDEVNEVGPSGNLDSAERGIFADALCRLLTGYGHWPHNSMDDRISVPIFRLMGSKLTSLGISQTQPDETSE